MTTIEDPSTFANWQETLVTHSDFDLTVDFDAKVITGSAKLHITKVTPTSSKLVLDTRDLAVKKVYVAGSNNQLNFSFGDKHEALGQPLTVDLPSDSPKDLVVAFEFATSPTSTAVQWLDPSQTAGGQHPYLFTQCQAIHARSFVPCQDTPSAKMTYTASVQVPDSLTALMSAVPVAAPSGDTPAPVLPAGTRQFHFEQKVPIPPYLLALAVGDLESRTLSDRSAVWSEPSVVDAAAFEFAETAKYLDAGEEIAGEYVWGRYDLLLLPPSFPYGGMENPCLTFVTPTLLAGDRSLTNVVAHEIAHSWTGNLVTNASWEHFWLNEGWTVFLERKILGRVFGEEVLQFHADMGYLTLQDTVKQLGAGHKFTALCPKLDGGVDPDDAFSSIPYEKGFYFLYYLQELVGGPSAFEPFMRSYFEQFKFKALTTEDFKACFLKFFEANTALQQIDWDTWLHAPGMPPVQNQYDTSLAQASYDLALKWHTCDVMGIGGNVEGASSKDVEGWSTDQWVTFLDKLLEYRSLTPANKITTRNMDVVYGLSKSRNAEVQCSWYRLCIGAEDEAVLPGVVELLTKQGRMKFLRPLYRALYRSKMGKQTAVDTFKAKKDSYHPIAQKMVGADLNLA